MEEPSSSSGNERTSFCILCCYPFPTEAPHPDGVPTFNEFVQETGALDDCLSLSSPSSPASPPPCGPAEAALCSECFGGLTRAEEKRSKLGEVEEELRKGQQRFLQVMRELKEVMGAYLETLSGLEGRIRDSQGTCLKGECGGREGGWSVSRVMDCRRGVVKLTCKFKSLRSNLSSKLLLQDPESPTYPPLQIPEIFPEDLYWGDQTCLFCCEPVFPNNPVPIASVESFLRQVADVDPRVSTSPTDEAELPVCPDCSFKVTSSVEKREKVNEVEKQVLNLQLDILSTLRRLQKWKVKQAEEMRQMEEKITADKDGREAWTREMLLEFWDNVLDVVKEFNILRNEIMEEAAAERRSEVDRGLAKMKNLQKRPKPTHQCPHCGLVFSQLGVLRHHLYTHTGERPYKCEYCGKAFRQPNVLNVHRRLHNGERPWKCDLCDKSFVRSDALRYHRRVHNNSSDAKTSENGEKEQKCLCNICGKDFYPPVKLRRHMVIHEEEKPHVCEFCGRAFKRSWDLTRHLKSLHSGKEKKRQRNVPFPEGRKPVDMAGNGGSHNNL